MTRAARWHRSRGGCAPAGHCSSGCRTWRASRRRSRGERWYHLDVPRHRVHFTPDGLAALLAAHGFAIVHTTQVLAEHNPFGMWQSIVSR